MSKKHKQNNLDLLTLRARLLQLTQETKEASTLINDRLDLIGHVLDSTLKMLRQNQKRIKRLENRVDFLQNQ